MPQRGFQRITAPNRPPRSAAETLAASKRENDTKGTPSMAAANRAKKITAADFMTKPVPPAPRAPSPIYASGTGMGAMSPGTQGQGFSPATGGGGGTASTSPSAASMLPGSTDPLTGWASLYNPLGVGEFMQNPGALATEVLSRLGFNNPYSGYLPGLTDYMENAPFLAYMAQGGQAGTFPTEEDIINYAAALGQSAVTPGGRVPDAGELLSMLYATPNDPSNPLNALLMSDPSIGGQADMLNAFMMAATQGYSPLVQRAILGSMGRAQNDYTSAFAQTEPGTSTPFYQYAMQNNMIPLGALGVQR